MMTSPVSIDIEKGIDRYEYTVSKSDKSDLALSLKIISLSKYVLCVTNLIRSNGNKEDVVTYTGCVRDREEPTYYYFKQTINI